MKKLLLGAALGLAFVACDERGYDRRPATADRETVAGRNTEVTTRDTTVRETTTDASASARFRVSKIDRNTSQVTLVPIQADTTATDVQPTAGREMTLSFDEFKAKASFTGDIALLKEGQEVTLKDTAPEKAPADTQTQPKTEPADKTTPDTKTY